MTLAVAELQTLIAQIVSDARQLAEADHYPGKRKSPRYAPWNPAIEVRANNKTMIARGLNISREGLGFTCKQPLVRGASVEVHIEDYEPWIPVRIQHCTQSVAGYKIGARFGVTNR